MALEIIEQMRDSNSFAKYVEKHPDIVGRLSVFLGENPGATSDEIRDSGFSALLEYASINELKSHFGVDRKYCKPRKLSDEEIKRRYEEFRRLVQETQGRFYATSLSSRIDNLITEEYECKYYRAVFDVCLNGDREYKTENFIPFANYATRWFIMKQFTRHGIHLSEDEREEFESVSYKLIVKVKESIDLSYPLKRKANFLLGACFNELEKWKKTRERQSRLTTIADEELLNVLHNNQGAKTDRGSIDDFVDGTILSESVSKIFSKDRYFTERVRDIFFRRKVNDETLESLSKKHRISRERVRQIAERTLRKLTEKLLALSAKKRLDKMKLEGA